MVRKICLWPVLLIGSKEDGIFKIYFGESIRRLGLLAIRAQKVLVIDGLEFWCG